MRIDWEVGPVLPWGVGWGGIGISSGKKKSTHLGEVFKLNLVLAPCNSFNMYSETCPKDQLYPQRPAVSPETTYHLVVSSQ